MKGGDSINGFEICRRRAGMTQVEAAKAIGVTQGTISSWEAGNYWPARDKVKTVAEVYGCTIDELFEQEAIEQRSFDKSCNIDCDEAERMPFKLNPISFIVGFIAGTVIYVLFKQFLV